MNSWCSRWALLTMPMVGAAIAARRAISPGWFMPISITAAWCAGCKRISVSGTPISLFRLPRVARRPSSPKAAARIAAIISLTVVLPLLPVTPMTGMANCARQKWPAWPSAVRVFGTRIAGSVQPGGSCSAITAAMVCELASCGKKSWPSKCSPRRATNSAPGAALRLSVVRPSKTASPAPVKRAPVSAIASCASAARISLSSSW